MPSASEQPPFGFGSRTSFFGLSILAVSAMNRTAAKTMTSASDSLAFFESPYESPV